jgi:hypothetical protein
MSKVDFRNAYKTEHLGSIDIEGMIEEGSDLIFTITHVVHGPATVAGKKGIFNIAYFKEGIKPLALNSGNAKIFRKLSGSKSVNPADWPETPVKLYIDENVKFGSDIVSGVRISEQPVVKREIDTTEAVKKLESATTTEELGAYWNELTVEERKLLTATKDSMKAKLSKA